MALTHSASEHVSRRLEPESLANDGCVFRTAKLVGAVIAVRLIVATIGSRNVRPTRAAKGCAGGTSVLVAHVVTVRLRVAPEGLRDHLAILTREGRAPQFIFTPRTVGLAVALEAGGDFDAVVACVSRNTGTNAKAVGVVIRIITYGLFELLATCARNAVLKTQEQCSVRVVLRALKWPRA